MGWKKDSKGNWVWNSSPSSWRSGYSSGKLIDTTSYYTSSSYNSRYYGSSWWSYGELSEEEKLKELLITKAYKAAKEMVVVLDLPFKVNLIVSVNDKYARSGGPDSRRIIVKTKIFDKPYSEQEKINIFCGEAIHEACHLKYTQLEVLRRFRDSVLKFESVSMNQLVYRLAELIEDVRIEREIMHERPGYSDFIKCLNEYLYENYLNNPTVPDLFKGLIFYIKFPEKIEEEDLEKNSELFSEVDKILNKLGSTKDSCLAASSIFNLIKDKISKRYVDCRANLQNNFSVALYGADKDSGEMPIGDIESAAFSGSHGDIFSQILADYAERGEDYNTYFLYETGNKEYYMMEKAKIQKYIPSIRKLLINIDKNRDFNIYGCRTGLLDTTKLAEAYQNVPQVYIRQGKVSTSKLSVCILVDESGSMGDYINKFVGSRADQARRAAILRAEGFNHIPGVDLFIYGHSADEGNEGETNLRIYREPGNKKVDKYALSDIQERFENRDGTAISEVCKRVRKKTDNKVLMMILSDGSPCACDYYGHSAWKDVRKSVTEAEKMNFEIVQINIGDIDEDEVNRTFKNNINLSDDMSALPLELAKIIKKLVIQNKETTISM